MRPASVERPRSAYSTRGTQQRLQQPTTRRVYPTESEKNIDTVDSRTPPTTIITVASLETKPIVEDVKDKSTTQQNSPFMVPLKQFVFKKLHTGPIEVHIRCIFSRVGAIDTLNERYYAEVLLEASWEEPSFNSTQTRPFDPTIHWTPELELMNGIGELEDDITYSIRYNKQGVATVTEHHKLKGTLWERMELNYFPVDVQELSLTITTSRTDKEVIFRKNVRKSSGVNRHVFASEQEWYLFEHVDIEVTQQIDEYLDNGINHPVVICSCHAARKYGHFIWNSYFLIFLITSASFTTFPIPLSNIGGRAQIACTLLLTSITFRWLCNKALPTISYLTAVDIYAIGSIFSLCLLNIYHGVIGYINYYQSGNTTGPTASITSVVVIDRWALVIFTILFFGYQIGTIIWMYLVPWEKRRIMFQKDKHSRLRATSPYNNINDSFVDVSRKTKT